MALRHLIKCVVKPLALALEIEGARRQGVARYCIRRRTGVLVYGRIQSNPIQGLTKPEYAALRAMCRSAENLYPIGWHVIRQYFRTCATNPTSTQSRTTRMTHWRKWGSVNKFSESGIARCGRAAPCSSTRSREYTDSMMGKCLTPERKTTIALLSLCFGDANLWHGCLLKPGFCPA